MHGRVPRRGVRRCSQARTRLRSESGAALIEIMMACLLVALTAVAVFKGIDGANATSANSKSRAIAAALAQDDQERLRATTPSQLVDIDQTKTYQRSGVGYTVHSTASWVPDRNADPGCTTAVSRAGYLKIASTVTWPGMRGTKPVSATSLLAPPNGTVTSNRGAVGIKVTDQNNQPLAGVSVSVTGVSLSGATDSNGCVFWDNVPQGNYNYTAQKTGYVDYEGDSSITRPIGVAGGQTRIDSIQLGVPTGMTVSALTKGWKSGSSAAAKLWGGDKLFFANSKMAGLNGVRSWTMGASTASVNGLYPMQYGVYMGACSWENNPSNDPQVPNGTGVFTPPFTGTQTIYEPMLRIRVRYNGSTTGMNTDTTVAAPNGSGPYVRVAQLAGSGGCSKDYTPYSDSSTWLGTTTVDDGVSTTDDKGRIADYLGFPYGTYRICAEAKSGSPATWRSATVDVDNDDPNGTDVDMNLTSTLNKGNGNGRCPTTL